ncbi:hypothetical protein G9A89_004784 [Geosiphon pyriformis]|nr:hypothetical protein G9A89_004784 [Geosiphon pyriformis]
MSSWKVTELEEESEDQEFNYQNSILENPKQLLQQSQQQLQLPPSQQQITYASIAKLEKIFSEEDDAQA